MVDEEVMIVRTRRPDPPRPPPPPPKQQAVSAAVPEAKAAMMQEITQGRKLRRVVPQKTPRPEPTTRLQRLLNEVQDIEEDPNLSGLKRRLALQNANRRVSTWQSYLTEKGRLAPGRQALPEALYGQLQDFCKGQQQQVYRDDDSDRDAELLLIARHLVEHDSIMSFDEYRRILPVKCHEDKAALEMHMKQEADKLKERERDKQLQEWAKVSRDQWSFLGARVLERINAFKPKAYANAVTPEEQALAARQVLNRVESSLVTPLWTVSFGATGIPKPPLWVQLRETGFWQQDGDAQKTLDLNKLLPNWNYEVPTDNLEEAKAKIDDLRRANADLKQMIEAGGGGGSVDVEQVRQEVARLQSEVEQLKSGGAGRGQVAQAERELRVTRGLLRDIHYLAKRAQAELRQV